MIRFVVSVFTCLIAITVVQAATPTQKADLSVTLIDSPDPVRQGEPLTYRITVSNHGPDVARNVKAYLTVPGNMPVLSMPSSCRSTPGTLECTLEKLAPGASASFHLTLRTDGSVRQAEATANIRFEGNDTNGTNNARGQVTRILYRIPKPEERVGTTSIPKSGDRRCNEIDYTRAEYRYRVNPALTPVEINGVWVVALPKGFQNQMPGSGGPIHIGVLFTAIDQPGFPDWIKLKRAVFTQGEAQHELLLDWDQEACRPIRPYNIEKNEKLLCADPQQVKFNASRSIEMHLLLEDGQGRIYEIVDEFCAGVAM